QRCGRARDRAAAGLEPQRRNDPARKAQPHRDLVTAQRVIGVALVRGTGERAVISGRLVVIEDHALVQTSQLRIHANASMTPRRPRASASTSWAVLYSANEARTVPATPKRAISGCAQCWPVRTAMPSRSSTVPASCG